MPTYIYEDPETGETKEVIQRMNEDHKFESNGKEWRRVFTNPQASIDTKWDEFSNRDFLEKTRAKRGTMGDLFDKSKELSQKREQRAGIDEKKQKIIKQYEENTGKKHPQTIERKKSVKFDLAKGRVS